MNLLKELSNEESEVVRLMVDNVSIINLSKSLIAHGRSKHIKMKNHYLKELVSKGILRLGYCRSEDQMTDLLIKGVSIEVFKKLKKHISMEHLEHTN